MCFRHFLLWREVLPEKRDAKGSVSTFERFCQALGIVYIRDHNFSTQSCEVLCLGSARISGKHASCETTIRVVKDGSDQSTALLTGCAHYCDDFSVAHGDLPFVLLGMCFLIEVKR